MTPEMRPFKLVRDEDETGISGVGVVGLGVQFPSGHCVMEWMAKVHSIVWYDNMDDLLQIHGHNGKTRVVFQEEKVLAEGWVQPVDLKSFGTLSATFAVALSKPSLGSLFVRVVVVE